ncbi:MAG TPA: helix-turn-helix transcriptional regulator [Burkholderiales bacterium]|nr:helix-turn-helix transcriptional regulator [Burkholderiales bacterium]
MSSAFVFDGLRMHLKARGMTYADLARALKISEATVKRIFATKNCTLERLDEICELLQVDLAELARGAPRDDKLINQLTPEQEQGLMAEPALLLVAICAIQQMRVDEMVQLYELDEAQCVALLLRLERIGILELHENNRIRLKLARTFAWNADGPIMRYARSQAPDFFDHGFDGAGEFMRMVTVRVSGEARTALLRRLEQVAREYDEQHSADARLPLEQRYPLSVLLAVRYWEPALFKALRRGRSR